ncbi:MAG: VOC family protein [Chloroflexi bacterium]|nr:MAG: VOC family protein [Chloroflexota bacterium]
MADRVIHFEVLGRDQVKLQRFYSDLFGWTFNTDNQDGYGIAPGDQAGIAVGVGTSRDGSGGGVTGYVAVSDIDAAIAKAERLGGRVVMPKMSPGPDATIALVADPEGHVIGLTQA